MRKRQKIVEVVTRTYSNGYTYRPSGCSIRDRYGSAITVHEILSTDSPGEHNFPRIRTMFDVVDKRTESAIKPIRDAFKKTISNLRIEEEVLIEEYRQRTLRQLRQCEDALRAAIHDYRMIPRPPWPEVTFLRREDLPETRLTHDIVEKLLNQCRADLRTSADSFWDFTFVETGHEIGLYNSVTGEINHNIMVHNRFRKCLRITQDKYQARLALEKQPGFSGTRLVTMDNTPFVWRSLELAAQNQKYWDQVFAFNAKAMQTLNEAALRRTLWYAERRKRIADLISMIRFLRSGISSDVARFRERYRKLRTSAIEDYRLKIEKLKVSMVYNEFHYLRSQTNAVHPEWAFFTPIRPLSGVFTAKITCDLNSGTLSTDIDRPTEQPLVIYNPTDYGEGMTPIQPTGLYDSRITRTTVGEKLAELGRGDGPRSRENVLSLLFELKDIPESFKHMKEFFLWMKRSYSARTLRGISFKTAAEAYLEWIYGIKPSYDSILYLISELRSCIEWIRCVVSPTAILSLVRGKTQGVSYRVRSRDLMNEEFQTVSRRRFLLRRSGFVFSSSEDHIETSSWTGHPSVTINWRNILGAYSDYVTDMSDHALIAPCLYETLYDTSLKLFARPCRDFDLNEARKYLLRSFLWDNSLGETFWNWYPFSFIADWFLGLKDAFKGLDQLFVVGYQGLERLYQPWFRRVDDVTEKWSRPQIAFSGPVISSPELRVWRDPSRDHPGDPRPYGWGYEITGTLEVTVKITSVGVADNRSARFVTRDELPDDTTSLLTGAFVERVRRAFKLKGSSGQRILPVSEQVIALGVASEAFTGVKPRGKRPKLKVRKDLLPPRTAGLFSTQKPNFGIAEGLQSIGFQVKQN